MQIRRAALRDLPGVTRLLEQVLNIHHEGRPDLFRANSRKYTDDELARIFDDDSRPVFVAIDENADPGDVLGYAFCIHQQHADDNVLTDIRTLYIDDLCVDERARGRHVGSALYRHVLDYARDAGCYNVTLNVWTCNEPARLFYERMGLVPQKIGMEVIL